MMTGTLAGGLALLGSGACRRDAPREPALQPPAATVSAASSELPSLQPEELARRLREPGDKPLLFHVGFRKLYQQAHIPGSEFLGPTSDADAVERLRRRVSDVPRARDIVLYCGCCPWERCPNVKPAYAALRELGFTSTKVLFIAHDLGADWVDRGYPVAKGD